MPTSWSGKAVTRSGADRRTYRLSYRRSSADDCVGRAKGEFVVKSKYAAFAALDPFFDVIQRGLAGLVDGEHYFDTIADDAVFEFRYDFPGWPRRTALSANVDETPNPWKFSVEGESGIGDVHGHGDVTDDGGDRGGGEGAAAAIHGRREAAGAARGGRLPEGGRVERVAATRRVVLLAPVDVARRTAPG